MKPSIWVRQIHLGTWVSEGVQTCQISRLDHPLRGALRLRQFNDAQIYNWLQKRIRGQGMVAQPGLGHHSSKRPIFSRETMGEVLEASDVQVHANVNV